MSIATEITRIKNNISSAYDKLQEIGATLPTNKNSNNLTATIESISGGGGFGQYDVVQTDVDGGCEIHITDGGTSDKMYYCKAIDYDGTVLKDGWYYAGQEFELPAFPTHDKLIAQEWSATSPIVDNKIVVSSDTMAGVIYTTKSGLTEFDYVINKATGYTVYLNMVGTKNWGDGTTNTLYSHTYSNYGEYTVTCNGTEVVTNNSDMPITAPELDGDTYNCVAVRCGTNVTRFGDFDWVYDLKYITLSKSIQTLSGEYSSSSIANSVSNQIETFIIPNGVTNISGKIKANNIVLPYGILNGGTIITDSNLVLPSTIQQIGITAKTVNLPNSLTKITSLSISGNVDKIDLPNNLTYITGISVSSAKEINLPNSLTYLGTIKNCSELENLVIPENIVEITASKMFDGCRALKKIVFSSNMTLINYFADIYVDTIYDFSKCNQVCSLNRVPVFNNRLAKFVVPNNLYEQWITSTTWSSISNYIYKASEVSL